MKNVIKDGQEITVTDKHARRLVYLGEAEYAEPEEVEEVKQEKKVPANKKDKTKKETK